MSADVYSSVKSMVGAVQARGARISPDAAVKYPYTVGFLESTIVNMLNKLPQKQQEMLISEMRKVTISCFEAK